MVHERGFYERSRIYLDKVQNSVVAIQRIKETVKTL